MYQVYQEDPLRFRWDGLKKCCDVRVAGQRSSEEAGITTRFIVVVRCRRGSPDRLAPEVSQDLVSWVWVGVVPPVERYRPEIWLFIVPVQVDEYHHASMCLEIGMGVSERAEIEKGMSVGNGASRLQSFKDLNAK